MHTRQKLALSTIENSASDADLVILYIHGNFRARFTSPYLLSSSILPLKKVDTFDSVIQRAIWPPSSIC